MVEEIEKTKVCGLCKKKLPVTVFGKDKYSKDGLSYRCKPCKKIKIVEPIPKDGYKFCSCCSKELPLKSFSWAKKDKGLRKARCKDCLSVSGKVTVRPIPKKGYKFCSKCGEEKPLDKFHKDVSAKTGVTAQCKECVLGYPEKPTPRDGHKFCSKCGKEKTLDKFSNRKNGIYGKRAKCRKCGRKVKRKYMLKHKGYFQVLAAIYYEENKDEIAEKNAIRYLLNQDLVLKYKEDNKERISENGKIYQAKNRDKLKSWNKEYTTFYSDRFYNYRQERKDKTSAYNKVWLFNNKGHVNARQARRRAFKKEATPAWSETIEINLLYKKAAEMIKSGRPVHVDHIVPLQSNVVCGLHCLDNLQILDAEVNMRKSNKWDLDANHG